MDTENWILKVTNYQKVHSFPGNYSEHRDPAKEYTGRYKNYQYYNNLAFTSF